MESAIFSCLGLGDGLISLVLAHNLKENGHAVTLFHPSLQGLQRWFPGVEITPAPEGGQMASVLKKYDRFFFMYEKSPRMEALLRHCETLYPEKTRVLNPIATTRTDYPYWSHGRFNGKLSFVENLEIFCREILALPKVSKHNGVVIPSEVTPRKYPKRIVIHPTSAKESKNWPRHKYRALAEKLKALGYEPLFTVSTQERALFGEEAAEIPSLEALATLVCESGAMIGNDSGIGHLASCLGLPTVTLCPRRAQADFWRPGWSPGVVLLPPAWIPNLKGLRLRDNYWKRWIGVDRVLDAFLGLSICRN